MSHQFYLQNGTRRSAQAFPIALPPGVKFSESKDLFGDMLGVPPEQIVRLTTTDGQIVLPGQSIPEEPLLLEIDRRAFDRLTGSGTFTAVGQVYPAKTFVVHAWPVLVVFLMFAGFSILLGGLASASEQCQSDPVAAWLISNLFSLNSNTLSVLSSGINEEFTCGLALSLFWFIILCEFFLCIIPAFILLVWAGSYSADSKGSWAYIITCTLNILTALLCLEAFVVVPGAYYVGVVNTVTSPYMGGAAQDMPANLVHAVQVLAAGVIILLVSNFCWLFTQACGKMIPEQFMLGVFLAKSKADKQQVAMALDGPMGTPTKSPTVMSV
eukprot:gene31307-6454_t